MAYFLKVTRQQSRTYLSIYESFYSPETKGTKHRSYRSLGNIQKLIALMFLNVFRGFHDESG